MSAPAQEREQLDEDARAIPALRLAGEDDEDDRETEPHICRGID